MSTVSFVVKLLLLTKHNYFIFKTVDVCNYLGNFLPKIL